MLLGCGIVAVARAGAQANRKPREVATLRCELDCPGYQWIRAPVRLFAKLFEQGGRGQGICRPLGDEPLDGRSMFGGVIRVGWLSHGHQREQGSDCGRDRPPHELHVARWIAASRPANHNARLRTYCLVSCSARGKPTSLLPGRSVTKLGAPLLM